MIGGNLGSEVAARRLAGVERAFQSRGVTFERARSYEPCRFSMDEGYQATMRLLVRAGDLTAIFALGDVIALGALRAISDQGYRVPADISLVGFDGLDVSQYCVPRLSTVRQDTGLLARRGVEALMAVVEGGGAPTHESVPLPAAEKRERPCAAGLGARDQGFEIGGSAMRRSGILLSVSSLPSPWGIGAMGAAAREFVDFLAASGQGVWQLLPLGPTGFGDSPYQSFSTFAGNPYLIDLDDLARDGLLAREEYADLPWGDDPLSVDYAALYRQRFGVLGRAVSRLRDARAGELAAFCERERGWLEDYALYMAIKESLGGAPLSDWPEGLRRREGAALADARRDLAGRVAFWRGVQFLFFEQWGRLRAYAHERGVELLGDVPIYVSGDGADVWAHPELFQLDADLRPTEVAGVPPDGFSEDGQLWGNPLFDWGRMAEDGYAWWVERLAAHLRLFDIVRIDHFRGLDAYYAVPAGDATARRGRWRPGPGIELLRCVQRALGEGRLVAEDLGYLTASVAELREEGGPSRHARARVRLRQPGRHRKPLPAPLLPARLRGLRRDP